VIPLRAAAAAIVVQAERIQHIKLVFFFKGTIFYFGLGKKREK